MPVVASSFQKTTMPDGRARYEETHTDHLGRDHLVSYIAAGNFDPALSTRAAQLEANLEQEDIEKAKAALETGGDVVAISPDHTTAPKVWRVLLKLYRHRDALYCVKLLPLLRHINANYTDAQIKAFLGITQPQLNAIRTRAVSLTNIETLIDADAPNEAEE